MTVFVREDENLPAYYRHNNGDLEPVMILDYDGKGNAWVRWEKDGFVNIIPVNRLEIISNERK